MYIKKIICTLLITGLWALGLNAAENTVLTGGQSFYRGGLQVHAGPDVGTAAHSEFGRAVSVFGDYAAISAPLETVNETIAGTVYIYKSSENGWQFYQKITPEEPVVQMEFGSAVHMLENTLMISAIGDYGLSGAVHVYELTNGLWEQVQVLYPPEHVFFQEFGKALDMQGDMALVSSQYADNSGFASGTVHVYTRGDDGWQLVSTIHSPVSAVNDLFGSSLCIVNNGHIVVSAPWGDNSAPQGGLVYAFTASDSGWALQQSIAPDNGRTEGLFGSAIDVSGDRLLVGYMESCVDSVFSGEALLYRLDESDNWVQEMRFIPQVLAHNDYFGAGVAIDNDVLVIGSPKWDQTVPDSDHGTVWVFQRNDSTWQGAGQLVPEELEADDHFGLALCLHDGTLLAGCSLDDGQQVNTGSSWFYDLKGLMTGLAEAAVPSEFSLYQNYPNPFNPVTTIRYDLPVNGHVSITVFDILGRKVVELVNKQQSAGSKQVLWTGRNANGIPVASGTYIYRIKAGDYTRSKKMVLIK